MKVAFSSGGLLATSKILPIEKGTLIVTPLLMSKNKNAHPRVFHSGAAILSSLQISPVPLPPLSPSFDSRALRFSWEACAAFSVRPKPSISSSSSCSVDSLFLIAELLLCSGDFFVACASRNIWDVCNRLSWPDVVADCCAPRCGRSNDVRVIAASSREIEDACLTAPAIPRGAAVLQDRPTATPEVLILVEKSAPFPRQSHARDAVLCEMFMLCLWRWYGR